jgi:hypothetical protein
MAKTRKIVRSATKKARRRQKAKRPPIQKGRIDHDLLDRFLAHVLEGYKSGAKTQSTAIADLAHLAAALDLGPGQGDDPTAYMKAIIEEAEGDD